MWGRGGHRVSTVKPRLGKNGRGENELVVDMPVHFYASWSSGGRALLIADVTV